MNLYLSSYHVDQVEKCVNSVIRQLEKEGKKLTKYEQQITQEKIGLFFECNQAELNLYEKAWIDGYKFISFIKN